MEFKGTKGSEQDQRNYGFNILYPNWDCEDVVGFYEQGQEKAFVVGYNQALEDSKAKEMLEMLKYIVKEDEEGYHLDTEDIYKIKQLIKQVTELK